MINKIWYTGVPKIPKIPNFGFFKFHTFDFFISRISIFGILNTKGMINHDIY